MSVGGDETELNGNDELFSGIDLQEFDDTDSKELNGSASLEEFEINGDDFLTVPFDTSNGKDYSLEHLRKSIANLSPLDAQESKMSDTTGEVESSANRVEAKLDNKKNYGDSHHSTLPVSNSDKETDVPVPPAFALMQSQNRPKAPKSVHWHQKDQNLPRLPSGKHGTSRRLMGEKFTIIPCHQCSSAPLANHY